MFTVRLSKNRHEIEITHNGHSIPVETAEISFEGKRRILILKTFDFQLLPDSQCPERNRYERILQAFGDSAKMAALQPTCTLVQLNSRACEGCPQRPI